MARRTKMIATINYVTGVPLYHPRKRLTSRLREFQPKSTAFKNIKRHCLTIEEMLIHLAKKQTPRGFYRSYDQEFNNKLERYRQTGEITAKGIPLKFAYTGPLTKYGFSVDELSHRELFSFSGAIDNILRQGKEWVEKEGKSSIGAILQQVERDGKTVTDAVLQQAEKEGTYFPVSFLNPWRRDRPVDYAEYGSKILIYVYSELKGEASFAPASLVHGSGPEGDYTTGKVKLKMGNVEKELKYGLNMGSSQMDFMYVTLDIAVRQILLGVTTTDRKTPNEYKRIIPVMPGDETVIAIMPKYVGIDI